MPKKKQPKNTLVAWLLDRTGSMDSVLEQTISGFNEALRTLKGYKGDVRFTLTMFDSESVDIVHNAAPVSDIPELNHNTYVPRALTPLYDAIGRTIHATEDALKGMSPAPSVLFYIQTDGQENASREYKPAQIFDLIKRKEAEGWQFVFLGANQDAWVAAELVGIARGNALSYDGHDTQTVFKGVGIASLSYMRSGGQHSNEFVMRHMDADLLKNSSGKKTKRSKAVAP